MRTDIEDCKDIFDIIICLCAEGIEFHTTTEILNMICEEAVKGYELCKSAETLAPHAVGTVGSQINGR